MKCLSVLQLPVPCEQYRGYTSVLTREWGAYVHRPLCTELLGDPWLVSPEHSTSGEGGAALGMSEGQDGRALAWTPSPHASMHEHGASYWASPI